MTYVLGTHSAELQRLGRQHRFWREECRSGLQRAGFSPGDRLLDLGCGPGFCSLELAELVGPSGQVDVPGGAHVVDGTGKVIQASPDYQSLVTTLTDSYHVNLAMRAAKTALFDADPMKPRRTGYITIRFDLE